MKKWKREKKSHVYELQNAFLAENWHIQMDVSRNVQFFMKMYVFEWKWTLLNENGHF